MDIRLPFRMVFSLILLLPLAGCSQDNYITIRDYAQGGTYHVILNLPKGVSQELAFDTIDSALKEIDRSVSGYNKGSLLSRLNAGADLPLDSIFIDCFVRSKEIYEMSGGAFDPSAAPLFDLWGFGFEEQSSTSEAAVDSILQFVGMDLLSLELRGDGTHLVKKDPRTKLNFNAIAQGYSCDLVAGRLEKLGVQDYLVEIGREIVCKGQSARGGKWQIGLDKPSDGNFEEGKYLQAIIPVTDRGIVTSGNYRKFYIKDGQKYAHTINPRSGKPVTHSLLSATVLAPDATIADACATWFMVIGHEQAMEMLAEHPELDACLIYDDNGQMKVWQTAGCNAQSE